MFHIAGITPEAPNAEVALNGKEPVSRIMLHASDMMDAWISLDSSAAEEIGLVALGNPHFSLTECARLATIVSQDEGQINENVKLVITMGREMKSQSDAAGYTAILERFGASFITDTCWCMITEPIIPTQRSALITNSGKYAHYAPGLVNRQVRFSNLAGCLSAARTGRAPSLPKFARERPAHIRTFATIQRMLKSIVK
jgi:predicted aconitase